MTTKVQAYAEHYTEKIDSVVADAIDQLQYLRDYGVMYEEGSLETITISVTDEEEQDLESLVDFLEGVRGGLSGDR